MEDGNDFPSRGQMRAMYGVMRELATPEVTQGFSASMLEYANEQRRHNLQQQPKSTVTTLTQKHAQQLEIHSTKQTVLNYLIEKGLATTASNMLPLSKNIAMVTRNKYDVRDLQMLFTPQRILGRSMISEEKFENIVDDIKDVLTKNHASPDEVKMRLLDPMERIQKIIWNAKEKNRQPSGDFGVA